MRLFNRKKTTIQDITLPDLGWEKLVDDKNIVQWVNPEQTAAILLNFFDSKPDLPTLQDKAKLRQFYRELLAEQNGGLILVDLIALHHRPVVKTIFKIPQETGGFAYLAALTIPFEKCSYVIKIQSPEIGVTGIREAGITPRLLKAGEIKLEKNGYGNWLQDPYDEDWKKGALMNKAEHPQYDSDFPNHPLTIARGLINQLEQEVVFSPVIDKLRSFR